MTAIHAPAAVFQKMADNIVHNKIEHNQNPAFGGAAVIVPPGGEPIEVLLIGNPDAAQFLSTVLSRLQIAVREIEDKQRMNQAYGMR